MSIRSQSALGLSNINVIEVQNNESAVLEESIIRTGRKLTAEAYDRKFLLRFFVSVANSINRGFRLALLDSVEGSRHADMVRGVLVEDVFEEGHFHCSRIQG